MVVGDKNSAFVVFHGFLSLFLREKVFYQYGMAPCDNQFIEHVFVIATIQLVFDSFIILPKSATELDPFGNPRAYTKNGLAIISPGLRFHQSETAAFQFGFTGMYANSEWLPVPIPMVQWYRAF